MSNEETSTNDRPRVGVSIFYATNADAKNLHSPVGSICFAGIGLRRDVGKYSCVPVPTGGSGVSWWSKYDAPMQFSLGEPLARFDERDIPADVVGTEWPVYKRYFIHPQLRGTHSDLMSVRVDGTLIQWAVLDKDRIVFWRLGNRVELELADDFDPERRFDLVLRWSHNRLSIAVNHYSTTHDNFREYGFDVPCALSVVPAELVRAIWKTKEEEIDDAAEEPDPHALRKSYASLDEFVSIVVAALRWVAGALLGSRPSGYWEQTTKPWRPKAEPRCADSLETLFRSLCTAKNIDVEREVPSRSGSVDFLFRASLHDHSNVEAIMELKKAHADDLEHGLQVQLPIYVEERGSPVGLYAVLWFKGVEFDRPDDGSLKACLERLEPLRPENVAAIVGFDVAFKPPASKA